MDNNRGFAVVLIIVAILVVGLAVGGLFYFLGSQSSNPEPTELPKVEQTTPEPTQEPAQEEVSESLDENVIEGELDGTKIDEIESDLQDIESSAKGL